MEFRDSSGLRVEYLAPIKITKTVIRPSGFALEDRVEGFFLGVVGENIPNGPIAVKYARKIIDGNPVDERLAYISSIDDLHLR